MKDIKKVKMGKASRAAGKAFELKVRKDLESKGWIVCKWSNNIEFDKILTMTTDKDKREKLIGKLIPAKHTFNPFTKAMSAGNGFPDFIAIKYCPDAGESGYNYQKDFPSIKADEYGFHEWYARHIVMLVESKMTGKLDKVEKEKIEWIKNNLKIPCLVASKGIKRGEIIYEQQ